MVIAVNPMTTFEGVRLRRSTAAQQVADALSERILAGAFPAGERLRESAIAAELGVARNTVREAVRVLELGGLVRYEVNRGAVVISPTAEALDALYTARERLETAAVMRKPTPAQLQIVEAAFDALVDAAGTRDPRHIADQDLALHAALVAMLGSSRLDVFYAGLARELRFYLVVLSKEDHEFEDPDGVIAEHEPIVAAVRSGDGERAVREVRNHIETNATRLRQIMEARA